MAVAAPMPFSSGLGFGGGFVLEGYGEGAWCEGVW